MRKETCPLRVRPMWQKRSMKFSSAPNSKNGSRLNWTRGSKTTANHGWHELLICRQMKGRAPRASFRSVTGRCALRVAELCPHTEASAIIHIRSIRVIRDYSFPVCSCCGVIHKRIGIIEESTKPCFRKNDCATFSGRSVSSVIRRKFFFFAKSIACSSSLLP